jgi:hypothetical protein
VHCLKSTAARLYRHHTASDIIDLDHETGRWRLVLDADKPAGAKVLADLPIAGSYEVEGDKHYFAYWAADGRFCFRTFDNQVFEVCQKLPDGSILMRDPGRHCTIEPARYGDGRLRQGMSQFKLIAGDGIVLFELVYNSEYYRRLLLSDNTAAASERDITDWDFFLALQAAFPIFRERFESGRIALALNDDDTATIGSTKFSRDELLFAESGTTCPRTGIWAAVHDLRRNARFEEGQTLPEIEGRQGEWVWSRER